MLPLSERTRQALARRVLARLIDTVIFLAGIALLIILFSNQHPASPAVDSIDGYITTFTQPRGYVLHLGLPNNWLFVWGNSSWRATSGTGIWIVLLSYWFVVRAYMTSRYGGSIGKLLTGVRVVDADGNFPSMGTSIIRFFAGIADVVSLGLGYIKGLGGVEHRRFADEIANTTVVRATDVGAIDYESRETTSWPSDSDDENAWSTI